MTGLVVPRALSPWIADAEVVDGREPLVHLPDAATTLVLRGADLIVVGPRTHAAYYAGKALPCCLRLRIRPGRARALLGPVGDLTNRTAILRTGDEARLGRELADFGDDPDRVLARIETALMHRLATAETSRGDLVRAAVRALCAPDPPRLPSVAARLGVSERHLRTVFAREVGLSPKRVARITRLRQVLARAGQEGWARLAADAGYYDQAHLTAEFRAMMGVPPGAYLAGRLPVGRPC